MDTTTKKARRVLSTEEAADRKTTSTRKAAFYDQAQKDMKALIKQLSEDTDDSPQYVAKQLKLKLILHKNHRSPNPWNLYVKEHCAKEKRDNEDNQVVGGNITPSNGKKDLEVRTKVCGVTFQDIKEHDAKQYEDLVARSKSQLTKVRPLVTKREVAHFVSKGLDTVSESLYHLHEVAGLEFLVVAVSGQDDSKDNWEPRTILSTAGKRFLKDVIKLTDDNLVRQFDGVCALGAGVGSRETTRDGLRGHVTSLLNEQFVKFILGDDKRKNNKIPRFTYSHWINFEKRKENVKIVGWPENLTFQNPSKFKQNEPLQKLLAALQSDELRFERLRN